MTGTKTKKRTAIALTENAKILDHRSVPMKNRVKRQPFLFPEMRLTPDNPWLSGPHPTSIASAKKKSGLTTLELCAGAGGQALGFDQAGIEHACLVELDKHACLALRLNRPNWNVVQQDLNKFDGREFRGIDIVSGGLPCPPFSVAGKQLGKEDERNLFPAMVRVVDQVRDHRKPSEFSRSWRFRRCFPSL